MNRRNFIGGTMIAPIASQLWPDLVFSQPNAKEYEKRALEFCERLQSVGPATCSYRSVTGEPYIVLQLDGPKDSPFVKKEGERWADFYGGRTPDEALESFKEAFLGYVANKSAQTHTLHWRAKPELTCRVDVFAGSTHEWYRFYARLLVTKTDPVEYYKRKSEGTLVS